MDWQTLIAMACVLAAAAGLSRLVWKGTHSPGTGCGTGCGSCPSSPTNKSPSIVELDAFPSRGSDDRPR